MDEEKKIRIWEEIVKEAKSKRRSELNEGEYTREMFMQQTGLSRDQARNFLEEKIRQGVLKKHLVILNGIRCNIYEASTGTSVMPPAILSQTE